MAYNIFDWVKEVTERKGNWEDFTQEDKDNFNIFMLNKCLSMYEPYIELVSKIQQLWALSPEQIYEIYKQFLPKKKIYYKYIKSTKDKINPILLKNISEYFNISQKEAKFYLSFLKEENIKEILLSLGIPKEEHNDLIKLK